VRLQHHRSQHLFEVNWNLYFTKTEPKGHNIAFSTEKQLDIQPVGGSTSTFTINPQHSVEKAKKSIVIYNVLLVYFGILILDAGINDASPFPDSVSRDNELVDISTFRCCPQLCLEVKRAI
jgi:hypothetical protein